MKKSKYILTLIAITVFYIGLVAQNPRFTHFKVLKNRQNTSVNVIFQDQLGYIWLGTDYGLVKYDGIDFVQYTENDSLFDNKISTIFQDSLGLMWIGHKSGGISLYDGKQFTTFSPEEGLPLEDISSFYAANGNVIWFSTFGEGLYYYAGENRMRLYNLNTDDGLVDNYVYTITQDKDGYFYFATDKGISVYDFDNKEFIDEITMTDGLPDNIVKHLQVSNNVLWVGMDEGGVCSYDYIEQQFLNITDWSFSSINDFICLSGNELWVSTRRDGVVRYRSLTDAGLALQSFNKDRGLADNKTNTVFLDRERNIWIGTNSGLSIRKNNSIEFLTKQDGFDITDIFSFTIDNMGRYWVASQQGLYIIENKGLGDIVSHQLFTEPGFEYHSFISLYKDGNGIIWAGTYGYGVFKIDPNTLDYTHFTSEQGISNDNIINITGKGSDIWLSTLGGGVTRMNCLDHSDYETFTVDNGLTSNYIYSVYIDSKDRKWIATDGGSVVYIKSGSVHKLDSLDYSTNKVIYSVVEDLDQNIWISCSENGLFRYDGQDFINYNESNGLRSTSIQSLTLDKRGDLVIISNEGIDKLILEDNSFEYHGEEDQVAYLQPNLNAVYKDHEENIWIGTANGIVKINALDTTINPVLPKVFITDISVHLNDIESEKNVFKYRDNRFTFNYDGLWFKSPEQLNFRYRLTGYDLDWHAKTKARMITYSNLSHGEYTFEVQVNTGSKWIGDPDAVFKFTIKPPFWITWWFITISVIVIFIIIYSYIQARLAKLQRDKELLEEEVYRRTKEIREQKEQIENQRDEIEAQKNYVTEQKDQIERQKDDITASIQYASRIQRAVLPPLEQFKKLVGDHFILFKPRDIVSGDFYYLNARDNKVIVAAADCTGHGVPGAFMSILGISLLNKIIGELEPDFNAGEILSKLRDGVKQSLRQTGKEGEAKDGMDISLCVIDKKEKKINYAGAYNPLILIRNKEVQIYKADRMPIGIFIKEDDCFTNNEIHIVNGDMLYMYSDGYQDQFGHLDQSKFMAKKLRELITDISNHDLEKQKEILDTTFQDWQGDEHQVDDVLVMGIRI